MAGVEAIAQAVIAGDMKGAEALTREAISQGISAAAVLQDGLIAGMSVVGERFRDGEIFVPEVLFSARAMQAGMNVVEPLLMEKDVKLRGKVLFGTVAGDLHDIGKNLVVMMLKGKGFTVVDLGTNVAPDKFVAAWKEHRPDIVAMSALLTTTMASMERTIEAFRKEGLRDQVKFMVGGAPVTRKFAESIGAEGYGKDAGEAVDVAIQIVEGRDA